MIKPDETLHPAVHNLVTGHFHQAAGYRTWRSRGTDDWLLIYTVSGRGRFGYDGGDLIARPGDWVLLRPGTRHDYGVESTLKIWELLWAHFQPKTDWLPLLLWPAVSPGLMQLQIVDAAQNAAAIARFSDANRLATGPLRNGELLAMNALEETLLWCDQANADARPAAIDPRIGAAMAFIVQNLARKIGLADIAEHVNLSPSRFAHLFKTETATTPQQFLEGQRLDRAAQILLRTTFSIKQIAAAVGFDNPFYFSLRFKARLRASPKAFRQDRRSRNRQK